jgi:hypothetical protein
LNTGKDYKVTALNMQGDALGTLNGSLKNNVFSFTADNARFPGGIVAYHLTTKK